MAKYEEGEIKEEISGTACHNLPVSLRENVSSFLNLFTSVHTDLIVQLDDIYAQFRHYMRSNMFCLSNYSEVNLRNNLVGFARLHFDMTPSSCLYTTSKRESVLWGWVFFIQQLQLWKACLR
jgi:hypothetical protein